MLKTKYGTLTTKQEDLEAPTTQCATIEHTTPVASSPAGNSGFMGILTAFSCCVAPRKVSISNFGPMEKRIGTGARSRVRKVHKPRHELSASRNSSEALTPNVISSASSASMVSSPILENWMEKFSDWRLVDIPMIPGTHHSGVNNPRKKTSQPVWGWAKTQDLGIEEQLHIGVRFFDLRIRVIVKSSEVLISHGLTSDTSLEDVLEVVAVYLQAHPSEGVILYIRADKWHGIDKESSELLSRVVLKSQLQICHVDGDPESILRSLRMKHISGKALVICPNDTLTADIPSIPSTVLQYCDIWQENSIDEAKVKIDQYMNKKPTAAGDVFGGVALDGTFPIRQQTQTSRELNQWFIERLSSDNNWKDRIELHQFGIILIDFADFDILNFFVGINNKLINIRPNSQSV